MLSYGIKVNEKLYKDTTHVIFKDGLLSTYKQAKKLGIPITTVLWIEACKEQKRLIDVTKFPIHNAERYENPEIYGRVRRQKSMQPEISKITVVKPKFVTQPTERIKTSDMNHSIDIIEDSLIDENEMERTLKELENIVESTDSDCSETSSIQLVTQLQSEMSLQTPQTNERRRLTTFTPRVMDQTKKCVNNAAAWNSVDRRRTIFTSHLEETNLVVQTPPTEINAAKAIFFHSANRVAIKSRRSVLDISMNIFELNCKAMSEAKKIIQGGDEEKKIESTNAVTNEKNGVSQTIETQKIKPVTVRKRKLFSTDYLDETIESKENIENENKKIKEDKAINKDLKPTSARKISNSKIKTDNDRRRTLSYFKSSKKSNNTSILNTTKTMTFQPLQKYIVCTNMTPEDKKLVQDVSNEI